MRIEAYTFGSITIDGETYTKDVVLLPPRVFSPWWRREGHRLEITDLEAVIAYAPAALVIGTGAPGMMKVPEETRTMLESSGIEVEVMPTEGACKRFGELRDGGKKVAGAFHLTC